MLNFILYNTILDYIIIFLFFINFILTTIIDFKSQKKDFKNLLSLDKVIKIKYFIAIIVIISLVILALQNVNSAIQIVLYFLIPIILLIKNIIDTYKKEKSLSVEEKYSRLWATCFFIIFFSSKTIPVYYQSFSIISHNIKEVMLIIYLLIKIILFTFLFLVNVSMLLSNIVILKPFRLTSMRNNTKFYKYKDYNFHFYNKYRNTFLLIIDSLIYFLLCIPIIIFNLFNIICLKFIFKFKFLKNNIIQKIYNFNDNSNKIIKRITNISIIIAFSIVYIITILDSSLFNDKLIQIYSFISTVILIPFIYDCIKS